MGQEFIREIRLLIEKEWNLLNLVGFYTKTFSTKTKLSSLLKPTIYIKMMKKHWQNIDLWIRTPKWRPQNVDNENMQFSFLNTQKNENGTRGSAHCHVILVLDFAIMNDVKQLLWLITGSYEVLLFFSCFFLGRHHSLRTCSTHVCKTCDYQVRCNVFEMLIELCRCC